MLLLAELLLKMIKHVKQNIFDSNQTKMIICIDRFCVDSKKKNVNLIKSSYSNSRRYRVQLNVNNDMYTTRKQIIIHILLETWTKK